MIAEFSPINISSHTRLCSLNMNNVLTGSDAHMGNDVIISASQKFRHSSR